MQREIIFDFINFQLFPICTGASRIDFKTTSKSEKSLPNNYLCVFQAQLWVNPIKSPKTFPGSQNKAMQKMQWWVNAMWDLAGARKSSCIANLFLTGVQVNASEPCPELPEQPRNTVRRLRKPTLPVTCVTAPSKGPKKSFIAKAAAVNTCTNIVPVCPSVTIYSSQRTLHRLFALSAPSNFMKCRFKFYRTI